MYTFKIKLGISARTVGLLINQLHVQTVIVNINIVSSNPDQARCTRYNTM
jgi:hypothetical protein